jgi:xanthosine utilization system XapX-like protein
MDLRHAATALGAGLTTGLLVAVAVIEMLAFELSALVGLPVGVLAGLVVLATVAVAFDGLDRMERRALSAYAAFGLTVLGLAALSYVNLLSGVSGWLAAVTGLVVAVLTYLLLWTTEHDDPPRTTP